MSRFTSATIYTIFTCKINMNLFWDAAKAFPNQDTKYGL